MPLVLPAERLGTVLEGKYRLDRLVGQGGMGAVIAGVHLLTGRAVAVKLLHPDPTGSDTLLPRFRQEARAAAALDHPNVVQILDVGETEDGAAYMVQELLRGQTLKALLAERGPLGAEETAELLLPLLHALGVAHARGIVHRDLKPDNVFLAVDATGRVTPKLLDFGIAKVAGSSLATARGLIVGTPEYMSPEQACGAPQVGAASDVWSMGAVLYECLAGVLPFEPSEDAWEALHRVRTCAPIPLGERARWLDTRVCAVVDRALVRDPDGRWANAAELGEALAAVTGRGPSATAPVDPAGATLELDATCIDAIPAVVALLAQRASPAVPTTRWVEPAPAPRPQPAAQATEPWEPTAATPRVPVPETQVPSATPFAWTPRPQPARLLTGGGALLALGATAAVAATIGLVAWLDASRGRPLPASRPARSGPPAELAGPSTPVSSAPASAARSPSSAEPPRAAAPVPPLPAAAPVVLPSPPATTADGGEAAPREVAAAARSSGPAPVEHRRATREPRAPALGRPPAPAPVAPVAVAPPRFVPAPPPAPLAPPPARTVAPVVIDNGIQVPR